MVSTNTKMYNLRWAVATPSDDDDDDDDRNSKLYKYSGHFGFERHQRQSGGIGQRTFLVRFRQGLLVMEGQMMMVCCTEKSF